MTKKAGCTMYTRLINVQYLIVFDFPGIRPVE